MAVIVIMPSGEVVLLPAPGIHAQWQPVAALVTRAERVVAGGENAVVAALATLTVEERADG